MAIRKHSLLPILMAASVSCLVFCAVLGVAVWQLDSVAQQDDWVAHSYAVNSQINAVMSDATDAETGQRGYVITQDKKFLDPYNRALLATKRDLEELRHSVSDNKDQSARVSHLEQAVTNRIASATEVVALVESGSADKARTIVVSGRGKQLHDKIRRIVSELLNAEGMLLQERIGKATIYRTGANIALLFSGAIAIAAMLLLMRRIHTLHEQVREMAMNDELTGLLNRRGFMTLANHHLQVTKRQKKPSALLFADMDGLKKINVTLGHDAGSEAIAGLGAVLKKAFRTSDLVARFGGDEFVVLATLAEDSDADTVLQRVQSSINEVNKNGFRPYKLAASLGITLISPDEERPIEELIDQADAQMYQQKQERKRTAV